MTPTEMVAARILSLCKENDMSLNGLAEKSGVPNSTIHNIIHGQSQNPRIETLIKIGRAFNMSPSEFLDFPEFNAYQLERMKAQINTPK